MTGIRATIDGIHVTADHGMTVLQAARACGIYIPTLCDHPAVTPFGACRLCLVEVEGSPKLHTACTSPITEGMVIQTKNPRVARARRAVLELILDRHPLECENCLNDGACELQSVARELGAELSSRSGIGGAFRSRGVEDANPFYVRDLDKCILCGRCVRVCREHAIRHAIDFHGRGTDTSVQVEGEDCDFCGQCVQVCPAGALIEKSFVPGRLPLNTRSVRTICPHCSTGCELEVNVDTTSGTISSVTSDFSSVTSLNRGRACVKGRFDWRFVHRDERLTTPLIKDGGAFRRATWREALYFVSTKLGSIKKAYGADSMGFFASHRCTNEENYLMQRLAKEVVGTNNINIGSDPVNSRIVQSLLNRAGAYRGMSNDFESIASTDIILMIGSDPTENQPVIGSFIKERIESRGCSLIVCDPRRTELAGCATIHVRQKPGSETALLNGIMNVVIRNGLYDSGKIAGDTAGFNNLRLATEEYEPDAVSRITGVSPEHIRAIAHAYASGPNSMVFYTPGLSRYSDPTGDLLSAFNLALLCGMYGRPGTGLNPLMGRGNFQGAIDAGCMPGFSGSEMMAAARDEKLKAMYLMGSNPLGSPDSDNVISCLKKLDFLVVQDILLTETAELADVILPAASWGERDGTYTNACRAVQRVRKALEPPGEARPDWEILRDIARCMGAQWPGFDSPESIFEEMRLFNPYYGGITYERLEAGPLSWPCTTLEHPGTPVLPSLDLSREKAVFFPIEWEMPGAWPTDDFPFMAIAEGSQDVGRSASMIYRRSVGKFIVDASIGMNPFDASSINIKAGERVRVTSYHGEVRGDVRLSDRVAVGTIRLPLYLSDGAFPNGIYLATDGPELGAVRLEKSV